jgi:hypothetical protein
MITCYKYNFWIRHFIRVKFSSNRQRLAVYNLAEEKNIYLILNYVHHVIMNSLTSAKQLYKHLIKESRKLPKDTQAYYRNYIRQVNIKKICNSIKKTS